MMPNGSGPPPWSRPGWLEQAERWIRAELGRRGEAISGPIEQPHVRPWARVLRVPTGAGAVYFKASAGVLAHEASITEALARWRPADLPELLAADGRRGWLLLCDGGTRLREVLRSDPDLRRWEAALPRYAELQIAVSEHLAELLALAIPDRRPALLPEHYRRLLNDASVLRVGRPDGVTAAEYRRLQELTAEVATLCDRLAAASVPASVQHGDLHDGNIFVRGKQFLFFDWGDGSLSHPFLSLRTVFVSIENTLGLPEGAPEFERLRDAYLEPWTRYAPQSELREIFDLARCLWSVGSALAWQRVVSSLTAPEGSYAGVVPSLMREFLADTARTR